MGHRRWGKTWGTAVLQFWANSAPRVSGMIEWMCGHSPPLSGRWRPHSPSWQSFSVSFHTPLRVSGPSMSSFSHNGKRPRRRQLSKITSPYHTKQVKVFIGQTLSPGQAAVLEVQTVVCQGTCLQNLYLTRHKLKTSCSLQRSQPFLTDCNVSLPLNTAYRYMHIWII